MIKSTIKFLSFDWSVKLYNKLLCRLFKHQPEFEHNKDMFGYEYVYQRCFCNRCGKRLMALESNYMVSYYD